MNENKWYKLHTATFFFLLAAHSNAYLKYFNLWLKRQHVNIMKISYVIGSLSSSSSSSASMFFFSLSHHLNLRFFFSHIFFFIRYFISHTHTTFHSAMKHTFIFVVVPFFFFNIYLFRCRIDFHNQNVIAIVNLNVDASF